MMENQLAKNKEPAVVVFNKDTDPDKALKGVPKLSEKGLKDESSILEWIRQMERYLDKFPKLDWIVALKEAASNLKTPYFDSSVMNMCKSFKDYAQVLTESVGIKDSNTPMHFRKLFYELMEYKSLPQHVFQTKETIEKLVNAALASWQKDITSTYKSQRASRRDIAIDIGTRIVEKMTWDVTTGILGRLNSQYAHDQQKAVTESDARNWLSGD